MKHIMIENKYWRPVSLVRHSWKEFLKSSKNGFLRWLFFYKYEVLSFYYGGMRQNTVGNSLLWFGGVREDFFSNFSYDNSEKDILFM